MQSDVQSGGRPADLLTGDCREVVQSVMEDREMRGLLAAVFVGGLVAAATLPALADHPCKPGEVKDQATGKCKSK